MKPELTIKARIVLDYVNKLEQNDIDNFIEMTTKDISLDEICQKIKDDPWQDLAWLVKDGYLDMPMTIEAHGVMGALEKFTGKIRKMVSERNIAILEINRLVGE